MTRLLRDQRVRRVALVVLLLLSIALAWHLVGFDSHADMEMALMGACLAVLVALGLIVRPRGLWVPRPASAFAWVDRIHSLRAPSFGRHPPADGTVLRR